jgi:hypothetical protein
MDEIFAKLGVKGIHLLTGLMGGSIALIFGGKIKTWRDKIKAIVFILAGAVVTGFITPMVILWKPQWIEAEYSIAFIVGIFGMGVIRDVFQFMYDFGKNPMEYLRMLRGGKK